jgi:hypothetical protein
MSEGLNNNSSSLGGTVAVALARVIIPLWLLTGAVLKLVDLSPTHLPAALISWLGGLGMDLMFVLRFSIAVELVVVVVMVLVAPLARWTGLLMLTAFVPVLVGDLLLGASSCGCFGAIQMSPWITLVTDITFLVGLAVLGRREPRLALTRTLPTWPVVATGVLSILSVALAFGLPAGAVPATDQEATAAAGSSGSVPLPADGYYLPDYETWLGQEFGGLDIAAWTTGLTADLETGQHYVMFYRKDCEHCHELMEIYFSGPLQWPTTAIAVPERDGWPTVNVQDFPCGECGLAELPSGVDWFFKTPVLVRLSDGVVECVAEEDPLAPECIAW